MSKEEWLHICRLNMEWYFVQTVFDGKPLSKEDKEWINEHMPFDDIFDDGRIEFFQENFKPIIDEDKLDELASEGWKLHKKDLGIPSYHCGFKEGYRKAKSKQLL